MAQNHIQPGKVLTMISAGAVAPGTLVLHGTLVGVALSEATAASQEYEVQFEDVFEVPKATGAISAGAKVYFVAADSNVSTTASGNTFCGYATEAALSGDATVKVKLWHT